MTTQSSDNTVYLLTERGREALTGANFEELHKRHIMYKTYVYMRYNQRNEKIERVKSRSADLSILRK